MCVYVSHTHKQARIYNEDEHPLDRAGARASAELITRDDDAHRSDTRAHTRYACPRRRHTTTLSYWEGVADGGKLPLANARARGSDQLSDNN